MADYKIKDDKLVVLDGNVTIEMDITKAKEKLNIKTVKNLSNFTKAGQQLGTNIGGFYKDETGKDFYVKFYNDPEIAKSENITNKLYKAVGANVPNVSLIKDGDNTGIASEVVDDLKIDANALKTNPVLRKGIMENFATDTWLGLWDVVGLDYDNLMIDGDEVIRVDVGGALRWRAMGGKKKPEEFLCNVPELDSMRDPDRSAGRVFGTITDDEIKAGIDKVLALTPETISGIVGDDEELFEILMCRREYLKEYKSKL